MIMVDRGATRLCLAAVLVFLNPSLSVAEPAFTQLDVYEAEAEVASLNETERTNQALESALRARDVLVERVRIAQTGGVFKDAVRSTVVSAIRALLRSPERAIGQTVRREWETQGAPALARVETDFDADALAAASPLNGPSEAYGLPTLGFREPSAGVLDLGDHRAIFGWLGNLYNRLRDRLGSGILASGIIGDVYVVSYALPVVFTPKRGDWKREYPANKQWVEYRRHFIPLANVATYHAVKFGCDRLAQQYGLPGQLCGQAATRLKTLMGRYLAPKLSDYAFNLGNGRPARWDVTRQDLAVDSVEQLRKELQ